MIIVRLLNQLLAYPLVFLIRIYQLILSPDKGIPSLWFKGKICAHTPHCSEYAILVLQRYGFFPGFWYMVDRIIHCRPSKTKKYDPPFYRVVFFSSAPIGEKFLGALHEDKRFEIVGVVTMPPKPAGRGLQLQENPIAKIAKKMGLGEKLFTPAKINPEKSEEGKSFFDEMEKLKPDFFVVIAYGKILPQTVLDIPIFGPINVHGSLLPKYRGASPIQSCLLNGDKQTGITIMKMDAGVDTGPMIKKLAFNIPFDATSSDLIDMMSQKGPQFLNNVLSEYAKGHISEENQKNKEAIICHKIDKEDGLVNLTQMPLVEVFNKYRAFILRPKIFFMIGEKRCVIETLIIDEKKYIQRKQLSFMDNHGNLNPAIYGCVVKPEGKKNLTWVEFMNGYGKQIRKN